MGLGYINSYGEARPSRQIGSACRTSCRHKCSINFNESDRETVYKHYWALGRQEKKDFFGEFVERRLPKKHSISTVKYLRKFMYKYHFPLSDKRHQVCPQFFSKTLGFGIGRVHRYFESIDRQRKKKVIISE